MKAKEIALAGCKPMAEPVKPFILRRHLIVFFASTACFIMFLLRYNLSVAIVAIQGERIDCQFDDTLALNHSADPSCSQKRYDYDRYTLAQFLAAYFYGYAAFQLPVGRWSEKYCCAKELIGYGILGSALLTLISPLMLDLGAVPFMITRLLVGVLHASAICCSYTLYGDWLAKDQRQTATTWLNIGFEFGGFTSFFLTGYISSIDFLGWRYAFYLFSVPAFLWFIPFHFMVYSSPDQDPNLSEYERNLFEKERMAEYLRDAKEESSCKKLIKVPPKFRFRTILTSAPVWASLVSKFAYGLGYYVITTKIPAYLSEVFNVPIKENGLYSAAPFVGILISKLICLKMSDLMIRWNVMSLTNVRKLFQSIAMFIPAICLFLITVKNDDRNLDILLIFLAMVGTGMVCGGDYAITAEFGGQLSGSIFGFTNTLSCGCGFIAPMLASFFLENVADKFFAWNLIFYSAVVVYLIGGVAFLIWATAEPQPWAQSTFAIETEDEESV